MGFSTFKCDIKAKQRPYWSKLGFLGPMDPYTAERSVATYPDPGVKKENVVRKILFALVLFVSSLI